MKFAAGIFFTMFLLIHPVASGADLGKLMDKIAGYNAEMQGEIKALLVVVKSQKAGTIEERTTFLDLVAPHLKILEKSLKKCEKTTNKIDKALPDGDATFHKDALANRKILYEARLLHTQAIAQLPEVEDTNFLKSLTEAIKYFSQMNDKLIEHSSSLKVLQGRVKG
jgi:hypothetical protein